MGFQMLAVISQRFPRIVITIWAILLLLFGMDAPKLPAVLKEHGLLADGDYMKVQRLLAEQFHIPDNPVILLFEREAQLSTLEFKRFIGLAIHKLEGLQGVSDIISPLEQTAMMKGNYAYAVIVSSYKSYEMDSLLEAAAASLPAHENATVTMTGKSVVQRDVNAASERDLRNVEMIGIPIAFVVLLFAFRGIVPAILPVVIGMTSVTITMGLMYHLGLALTLSNFVLNVIPMVGLALSIDFALLIVSRFREELESSDVKQAMAATMDTAGRSVLLSGVCAGLGLAGILFIPLPIFTSVAVGAIAVLTVSVLLTLTLLPALLTLLSPFIRAASKPRSLSHKRTLWHRWASFVMRRPVIMSLLASLLLASMLMPLNKLEIAIPDASSLPQHYASRIASQSFAFHFDSPSNAHVYLLAQSAKDRFEAEEMMAVHDVVKRLEHDPLVAKVDSVFSTTEMPREKRGNSFGSEAHAPRWKPSMNEKNLLVQVILKGNPASTSSMDWVRKWEQQGDESQKLHWLAGGEAKYQQEVYDAIFNNIKYVALFIFTANFIVLAIAFRSIVIPLKTIAMNVLSLGASFGILAWIFDEGIGGIDVSSIAIMIPVFIFGLVFGISMDYGVFLVSRIYEAYRKSGSNEQAIVTGLVSTSRMITSAAAILIAVTAPFALGEVAGVRQLGIGIAAAILVDATIIRLVLVPSLMKWLGHWNWWTPWSRRE